LGDLIKGGILRIRAVAAMTIVLALTSVVGCGGTDQSSASNNKAAFIHKANAICEATRKALTSSEAFKVLREVKEETGKSGREAEAAFIPKWVVPKAEAEVEEIRSLGAPSGDEDRIEALLSSLEDVLETAKSHPKRYLHEQFTFKHPYRKVEKLATEYGIAACGQP
jgi:hypothetical protein